MKLYKKSELILNLLLIGFFLFLFIPTKSFEFLFIGYFVIGGVQLLSMIVHLVKGWFITSQSLRVSYYWALVIIAITVPFGPGILFLLYAAPFMALSYIYICYREWKILKLKEFVHLK